MGVIVHLMLDFHYENVTLLIYIHQQDLIMYLLVNQYS